MRGYVRLSRGKLQTVIQFNYNAELVDLVKSYDGREYNPDNRTWTIYNSDVIDFIKEASKLGFSCKDAADDDYDYAKRERQYRQQREQSYYTNNANSGPPPRRSSGVGNDWACQLFVAVGPELTDKAYKVMSRVVHPDVGGSEDLMKQLNSAYDLYKKK